MSGEPKARDMRHKQGLANGLPSEDAADAANAIGQFGRSPPQLPLRSRYHIAGCAQHRGDGRIGQPGAEEDLPRALPPFRQGVCQIVDHMRTTRVG